MLESDLINDLQTRGMRLVDPRVGNESRRGGAGPSDHKAVTIGETTVMVPVHTAPAFESPYLVEAPDGAGRSRVTRDGAEVARVRFPSRPRFYDLKTAEGVPYNQIAVLHSRDVLATTVLQTCIRYESRKKTCQFCAIGQSLAAGRTIAHKTPAQLAERLARGKAAVLAARHPDAIVLAADTVVSLGRRFLEKAADEAEATRFLKMLSGRNHRVHTGVAVARGDRVSVRVVETRVALKVLSEAEIAAYVASGDWRGKAGAYGIQGPAGAFVRRVVGSHPAVMGLPLYETVSLLEGVGYRRG